MTDILVRPARRSDLPRLVEIFNFYVANGHVTFDTEPNTIDGRTGWFENYGTGRHQLLVAQSGDTVVGCTYSSRYRPQLAFDATVETSIYLDPAARGRGVGTRLYTALLHRLAVQPVHLAVAAVALPNEASLALHRKHGFAAVGTFREYASKRGAWISSTWFQRAMPGATTPDPGASEMVPHESGDGTG